MPTAMFIDKDGNTTVRTVAMAADRYFVPKGKPWVKVVDPTTRTYVVEIFRRVGPPTADPLFYEQCGEG